MSSLSLILVLFAVAHSVDVWTPFVNEEGLEYDISANGVELSRFTAQYGGNGGGPWSDDCETKGGLKNIQMQCGTFVGSFRLQCANNQWQSKRGLGRGHGSGGVQNLAAKGITKVIINAGSYVDRIRFFKTNAAVPAFTCGRSRGGRAYTAQAPPGMQLCALRGRAGWWMDKLSAGWCKKGPCCCTLYEHCDYRGRDTCIDANNAWVGHTNDKFSSIKVGENCRCTVYQHARFGGKSWVITQQTSENSRKCFTRVVMQTIPVSWNDQISSVRVHKIKRHCQQSAWKCGACNKATGTLACTRTVVKGALHGGNKCGAAREVRKCKVNCEVGGFGAYGKCNRICEGRQTRTRRVTVSAKNGGRGCPTLSQSRACNPCLLHRGKVHSTQPLRPPFKVCMDIFPHSYEPWNQWKSILFYGNNNRHERGLGIWLYPQRNFRIHVRVKTLANWNDGCDPGQQLARGRFQKLCVQVNPMGVQVSINNREVCRNWFGAPVQALPNRRLYLGAPWYPPANAWVRNVRVQNLVDVFNPVLRYWSGTDHFYTTNWHEIASTARGRRGKHGYTWEGSRVCVFAQRAAGRIPIYRYWHPGITDHFYTQNWNELGRGRHGWRYEGILGYGYPANANVPGTFVWYRYWNPGAGDHFYTDNFHEIGHGRHGWRLEGSVAKLPACYAGGGGKLLRPMSQEQEITEFSQEQDAEYQNIYSLAYGMGIVGFIGAGALYFFKRRQNTAEELQSLI